jgi:amidase/aspartyl-tRNA(Asn)/glutamyl-tRNA(Gln) amidotransferase subunit A
MTTTPISDASDLCRLGVDDLARAYAKGEISPVDVTRACLERAESINPRFNAFTFIDHAGAMSAAMASEQRWRAGEPLSPIDGVPTTLKNIVRVQGWSVTYGSLTADASPYADDAPAVAKLRSLGAVFIGQTTSPEFGWKAVTDSAINGITRNPWNPDMTPGGSSGGAAVAAAVGAGVLHLGTDGAGSIRIPCAFTGLAGIKPTFGRVPAYPPSPFGTIAHLGPMTRRVTDTAHMLRAMSGRDLADWAQGAGDLGPLDDVDIALKGARIAVWSVPPCGYVDPQVASAFAASVKALEHMGAILEPINLPYADTITSTFEKHWFTGAAARLAGIPADQRALIDPDLKLIAERGAAYRAPELIAAQVARGEFGAAMDKLTETYDFIVAPGTAIPAFEAGKLVPAGSDLTDWHLWAGFTFPINLSTQPAAVVPNGRTADGLPISLQFIGARGADAKVLAAAKAYETAFPDYVI